MVLPVPEGLPLETSEDRAVQPGAPTAGSGSCAGTVQPPPSLDRRRLAARRWGPLLGPSTGWLRHVPVAVLILAYAVRFGSLTVNVLHGYGEPAFDLGIPDQGIWLLSRFHNPFVTVMGRQLFGDHTSFIYLLLVPLYWVYPHTSALLIVQADLLATAAIPIYLLGRHLLHSTTLATLGAAAYLLNPALQQGNMEQFHVEAFEVALIAWAIWAAVVWRPRLVIVAVGLLLLCKEDAAMYAVPLAVWVFARRDRRVGAGLFAGSLLAAGLNNWVAIPALLGVSNVHTNRLPFGGIGGAVREIIRHPGQVASYLVSDSRPYYVWQLTFAAGGVFVTAPEIAAVAVVGLGVNLWSTFPYQHQIEYHYTLTIVPVLACGTLWAVSRLRSVRWRRAAMWITAAVALEACVLWGLAPFSDKNYPHTSPSSPLVAQITYVLKAVPRHAAVSAYYDFVPELDHRRQIYMWPNPFHARYWGDLKEEGMPLPFESQVRYVVLPTWILSSDTTWPEVAPLFHPVRSDAAAILFERN